VARGEIGLLIIQVGFTETAYLSEEGFIIGIWASLLNTIIGPITVGLLIKRYGRQIVDGTWGYQAAAGLSRNRLIQEAAETSP